MRQQVQHRLFVPVRLVEEAAVLFEAAAVVGAEERGHARPGKGRRLAAIVEARPHEGAEVERPRIDALPGVVDGVAPGRAGLVVVGDDVAVFAVFLPLAAHHERAGRLRAEHGLVREFGVERVVGGGIVVDAHDVEDRGRALVLHLAAVERAGAGTAVVQPVDERLHPSGHAMALARALKRLLVKHGVHHHAGVIAAVFDHALQAQKIFLGGGERAVFLHHQHALPVADFENFGIGVVRAAIGVRAQLLEQRDAVFLDGVGHGRAHAGVILMIAEAAHLDVLAVEEEALVRVVADRAQARLHALEMLAEIAAHARLDAVEVRRIDRPQLGLFDGDRALHDRAVIALHRSGLYSRAAQAAGGRVERGFEREITVVFKAVFDGRLDFDRPAAFLKDRLGPDAVVRDVRGGLLVQPDAAIDARALVPPALPGGGVHAHGQHVGHIAEVGHVGQIDGKALVAAEISVEQLAVKVDLRVAAHALKVEKNLALLIALGQLELDAVPADAAPFVAVVGIGVGRKVLKGHPVVRQGDFAPVAVVKVRAGRAELRARLGVAVDRVVLDACLRRQNGEVLLDKAPAVIQAQNFGFVLNISHGNPPDRSDFVIIGHGLEGGRDKVLRGNQQLAPHLVRAPRVRADGIGPQRFIQKPRVFLSARARQ